MEISQPVDKVPTRRNQALLIAIGTSIVVCCCCIGIAIAGFYGFTAIQSVVTQEIPPFEDFDLSTPESSDFDFGVGDPPEGGLGNEILRSDTWQYVAGSAMGQGCDRPIGASSTIEVLQEPDDSGVWLEKWTVVCRSGDSYAFEVEYILDDTGATFNIRSLP